MMDTSTSNSMESILASYTPSEATETESNSEPEVSNSNEAASTPAVDATDVKTAPESEGKQVEQTDTPEEEKTQAEPEAPEVEEPKGGKANLSRSKKRDYAIMKWKKQFRDMRAQRDAIAADFEKYKNLNPQRMNPQDAYDYMAWKASAGQRLQDMNEDLRAMYQQHKDEEFEEKVDTFFNDDASRAAFDAGHEELKGAFDYACRMSDPDDIIRSYLDESKFEAPMRHVIYNNDALQRQLFMPSKNKALGNAQKLQIMQQLEAEVRNFYRNKEAAPKQAAPTKPVQPQTRKVAKWHIPPRDAATGRFVSGQATQIPAKKPSVTGRIATRTENTAPNTDTMVSNLYTSLFGKK